MRTRTGLITLEQRTVEAMERANRCGTEFAATETLLETMLAACKNTGGQVIEILSDSVGSLP